MCETLRYLDVGSVVFSGKWWCSWHKLFVFLYKRAVMVPLCVVWRMGTSLRHCLQNQLFYWNDWRALGNMGLHLNNWMKDWGLVRVMGGDRPSSQSCFCLWVWHVVMHKGPLVYITAVMVVEIVQYSFYKSPLELVVVVPICILLIYCLYFVVLHYGPLTVSSFAGTKFDTFVACHTRSNVWGLVYILLCWFSAAHVLLKSGNIDC